MSTKTQVNTDLSQVLQNKTLDEAVCIADPTVALGVSTKQYSENPTVTSLNSSVSRALAVRMADVYNVRDFGALGDNSNDDTAGIQAAIDAANTKAATGIDSHGHMTVLIPHGYYRLTAQIIVKPRVNILCEGILSNYITDSFQPCIWFKAGSHCTKLRIWGNLKSGVQFGEVSVESDMIIGDVRLWNMGVVFSGGNSQKGVYFTGYNFRGGKIYVDGGNIGIDMEAASDVRLDNLISVLADTAFRITNGCENIYIGNVIIDSCQNLPLQIDPCNNVHLPDVRIYINDNYGAFTNTMAARIGTYASGDVVNHLRACIFCQNTGGYCLDLSYMEDCHIELHATRSAMATGNAKPITKAIVYNVGYQANNVIDLYMDGAIPTVYTGTLAGTLIARIDGAYTFNDERIKRGNVVHKAADEVIASSTTLQADDHLTVNLAGSAIYKFQLQLFTNNIGAAEGIKLALAGTVGVSSLKAQISIYDDVTTNALAAFARVTALNSAVGVVLPAGDNYAIIEGVIETTTSGTLRLDWAQQVVGASVSRILRNSSFMTERIG